MENKNFSFALKTFINCLGRIETFYNKINPRYSASARLLKKNSKLFLQIIFELFDKVKNLERKIISDEDKN